MEELHHQKHLIIIASGRMFKPEMQKVVGVNFVQRKPGVIDNLLVDLIGGLDFYINATLSYDIRVPKRVRFKIHFPHTITSKTKYDVFSRAIEKITDVFLSGNVFKTDALTYCKDNEILKIPKMHSVGCPKSDTLFQNKKIDRSEFLRKLGLNPNLPTVFFAPTWNPHSSAFTWLEEILKIPETHNANLIVKIHPGAYIDPKNKKSSGGIDWKAFFESPDLINKGIYNVVNSDSPDFISASDVTITDISTIWIEYYYLRKPIIFLDIPEFFKTHEMNSLGDFRMKQGFLIKSEIELNEALGKIIESHRLPQADYSWDDDLLFNKGRATEVALKEINGMYEEIKNKK